MSSSASISENSSGEQNEEPLNGGASLMDAERPDETNSGTPGEADPTKISVDPDDAGGLSKKSSQSQDDVL